MPPIREVKTLLKTSIDSINNVVRQEAIRVSKYVEDNLIYNEIPGTDEFNFEDEDTINAKREIYLSEQVTAFKVRSKN